MALHVPEICFWPVKLQKTLNFLRCIHVIDLVLEYGSDIKERNWLQLLFYFIILMDIVSSLIGLSFLLTVSQVLDRTFLVLHFDGNVCKWIHKVIRPWMNWFLDFLFENVFFRWLHIVTDCNLQWLLNCYSFWWHRFVWCLVWGVFGLLFKLVFTFQP